jgi:hypothetical protein
MKTVIFAHHQHKRPRRNILKEFIYWVLFRVLVGKKLPEINELGFIQSYLKKKGYASYGNVYTKGFVVIEIEIKDKKINSISIFTDKVSKSKHVIIDNFSTSVIISENYFQRL